MFTKEGETPYELIFENLMKGMDEEEIIERGLGIMRKECYLLHNVDILSNCDLKVLCIIIRIVLTSMPPF